MGGGGGGGGETGTALHYTIIAHSKWIQRCVREQYVYIVPYETGVMWLMESSFFVNTYPAPTFDYSIHTK